MIHLKNIVQCMIGARCWGFNSAGNTISVPQKHRWHRVLGKTLQCYNTPPHCSLMTWVKDKAGGRKISAGDVPIIQEKYGVDRGDENQ